MLTKNSRVILRLFNGSLTATIGCDPKENYWALIGERGTVVEPRNDNARFLVKFDCQVSERNLHCHNPIPNSLYILETDLEEIK